MHLLSSAVRIQQFGDLGRCSLRPGNVHSADEWDGFSSPSWRDAKRKFHAPIFAPTPVLPIPMPTSSSKPRESSMRSVCPPTASCRAVLLIISADAAYRPAAEPFSPVVCELPLSSRKLDEAALDDRQGRMASGRASPARRIHCDQHGAPRRECRGLPPQTLGPPFSLERGFGLAQGDGGGIGPDRCPAGECRRDYGGPIGQKANGRLQNMLVLGKSMLNERPPGPATERCFWGGPDDTSSGRHGTPRRPIGRDR
jgi:hypothetical protein